MESLKNVWDALKGKIAATVLAILFGLGVVINATGLNAVECPNTLPEGSVCLAPATVPAASVDE